MRSRSLTSAWSTTETDAGLQVCVAGSSHRVREPESPERHDKERDAERNQRGHLKSHVAKVRSEEHQLVEPRVRPAVG